jgi:hypothetical protein
MPGLSTSRALGAFAALFALLLSACAPAGTPPGERTVAEAPTEMPMDQPLATSLRAEPQAGSVLFTLQVTNATEEPVELVFNSGQEFDFVVQRGETRVWRWSDEMMFTQAIQHLTLSPGETRTYTAAWSPEAETPGDFEVTGILTAQDHRVEQRTGFRLP